MAYVDVPEEMSEFFKFEKVGDLLEGHFCGSNDGQYGLNLNFEKCTGKSAGKKLTESKFTVTVKGALKRFPALTQLEHGDKVLIGFKGTKPSKFENPTKLFAVKVDTSTRTDPSEVPENDPFQGDEDEVEF